ncbi:hypothetical protein GCM10023148_27500 [Actinokineospora soli]
MNRSGAARSGASTGQTVDRFGSRGPVGSRANRVGEHVALADTASPRQRRDCFLRRPAKRPGAPPTDLLLPEATSRAGADPLPPGG